MIFRIKKKDFYQTCSLSIKLLLLTFALAVSFSITQVFASSNINSNNSYEPSNNNSGVKFNKSEELIFKVPNQQQTDISKLEYKSTINLPDNGSWVVITQPESSSEPLARIIKKNDNTFLSVLETNQYPVNTSKVVFDMIEVVDINESFYRIPNIKTPATNDYVYIDKVNTVINYRPDQEEIKNFDINKTNIIFLKKEDNQYSSQLPEDKVYQLAMIQQKNGDNNWSFGKHELIGVTADNNQDLMEADQIVKNSQFDNQNYALSNPTNIATNTPNKIPNNQNTTQSTPTANSNILPYAITLGSFGLVNLIIRQYFAR